MKAKVFMGYQAGPLEEAINGWLEQGPAAEIIKTEVVVTALGKQGEATFPCVVAIVWYEPKHGSR